MLGIKQSELDTINLLNTQIKSWAAIEIQAVQCGISSQPLCHTAPQGKWNLVSGTNKQESPSSAFSEIEYHLELKNVTKQLQFERNVC